MANKSKPSGPTQPERKGGGGGTRDGGKQNRCGECGEVNGRHALTCSRR